MASVGIIYSIICKVNQKRYIGQTTKNLSVRWKQHIAESKNNTNRPLYNSINKYGVGMFVVRELEADVPYEKLSERESYWIEQFDTFNNGFNLTTGGEQNKNLSPEVREKISSTMLGVSKTEEHTSKMRKTLKERNIGFSVIGDGKHLRMQIKAICVENGKELFFDSIRQCGQELHILENNISRAISKGWLCSGYKFEKIGRQTNNNPIVGKCKITGEILYEFDSVSKCSLFFTGTRSSGVRKSLKNQGKSTYKGCYWYYQ